jgi:hypothetical protein
MAIPIKSAPVLEGKAAREFYERWSKATESRSKEEVQESMRKTRAILAKQVKLYDYD